MLSEPSPRIQRTLHHFRTHLLLTSLIVTAAFAATIALSIFAPLAAQLSRTQVDSDQMIGLADHFLFVHSALWPLVFLSLVSCIVSSTLLFLRMRQPLKRMVRAFDAVTDGRVPDPITIRDADYLSEEASAFNKMLIALRERSRERAAWVACLNDAIDELSQTDTDAASLEQLRAIAKEASEEPASGPRGV